MRGRSLGVTMLTVAFEVVAVGCFLVGARGLSGAPPVLPVPTALLLWLLFFVSAGVAFGLHGLRAWTHALARVWAALGLVTLLWLVVGPEHAFTLPWQSGLVFTLVLAGSCAWLEGYLPRVLRPAPGPS